MASITFAAPEAHEPGQVEPVGEPGEVACILEHANRAFEDRAHRGVTGLRIRVDPQEEIGDGRVCGQRRSSVVDRLLQ
jgi:hypothetical protein